MRDAAIDPLRPARRSGAGPGNPAFGGVTSSAAIAARRLGGHQATPSQSRGPDGLLAGILSRTSRIRPWKALATGLFSLTLVGIVANAVVFQKGRHPAPLLGTSQAVPAGQREAAATRTLDPPAAPAPPPARSGPVAAVPVNDAATSSDEIPPASVKRAGAKPQRVDAIGKMLHAKSAVAETVPAGPASAEKASDAALLATQKRLAKLGYAVKPDGRMGTGTRRAIAQFEHDHHLKSEAEVTLHLRREIAAATPPPEAAAKAR